MPEHRFILIGRHAPDGLQDLGIDVIEQRAIVFPPNGEEAWRALSAVAADAWTENAGILLQNTPAPLGEALLEHVAGELGVPVGIIVSEPGERPPETVRQFEFPSGDAAEAAVAMLTWANPRAKATQDGKRVTVRVAPPMRFKLHHVTLFYPDGGKEILHG